MSEEECIEEARVRHKEICERLNVDAAAAATAWTEYAETAHNFSLEGDQTAWIGCALYSACRRTATPTIDNGAAFIEGNCVSLTQLLQLCNTKLSEFFNKIKRWMDMTTAPESFRKTVEKLERNFCVSALLFQKYRPIFAYVFMPPDNDTPSKPAHKSSKKNKLNICTPNYLFEMCWYLFICIKGEFPHLSDDLVHMYHMLLSCMDTMFANAYLTKKDLINPNFEGRPSNWANSKLKPKDVPCIIGFLCKKFEGIILDAKSIKQYSWKPTLKTFFEKGFLTGDIENLSGLLDPINFDSNLKTINEVYGTYILSVGEFDERKFLGNFSEIGDGVSGDEITKALATCGSQNSQHGVQDTPLTGRKYLNKKNENLTPVSLATQSVAKLHCYLSGCSNSPSLRLLAIFDTCEKNPLEFIVNHQKMLAVKFLTAYAPLSSEEVAGNRLNLAEVLYYRLLEYVIIEEQQRKKGRIDFQRFLTHEVFLKSLFVCSLEIVIHAYSHQTVRFPWILNALNMEAFDFYKIIELVVLVIKEKLSRDVVKHLNAIEEQVLESTSWASNSPIWQAIKDLNEPIPMWNDVRIEDGISAGTNSSNGNNSEKYFTTVRKLQHISGSIQSPTASASERFLSPKPEFAKKQLFKDSSIKPGQSLLSQNMVPTNGTPEINLEPSTANPNARDTTPQRRRVPKGGSLGIFFRKFYSLASERMKFLCNTLMLEHQELKQKIWTCFEYTIINQTHLMKDRHLDQILMCTLYVICKVSSDSTNRFNRTFTSIMRAYRLQPRADSHVYRSVLASLKSNDENEGNETNGNVTQGNRVDLIEFYNTIYIHNVQQFVMRFTNSQDENYTLNPVPAPRSTTNKGPLLALQRVSDQIYVHMHPLTESLPGLSQSHGQKFQLKYCFNRSSAKDLQHINSLMSKETVMNRKRPSVAGDDCNKKISRLENLDQENETDEDQE